MESLFANETLGKHNANINIKRTTFLNIITSKMVCQFSLLPLQDSCNHDFERARGRNHDNNEKKMLLKSLQMLSETIPGFGNPLLHSHLDHGLQRFFGIVMRFAYDSCLALVFFEV